MGMATYYLKARFASPKAAQAALPELTALIQEVAEAENWWRAHGRHDLPKAGWLDFKQQFPRVFNYLEETYVPTPRQRPTSSVSGIGTTRRRQLKASF